MKRVKSISISFNDNDMDNRQPWLHLLGILTVENEGAGRSENRASHLYAAFTFYPNLK